MQFSALPNHAWGQETLPEEQLCELLFLAELQLEEEWSRLWPTHRVNILHISKNSNFCAFPFTLLISAHPCPEHTFLTGEGKAGHPCTLLSRWVPCFCQALITENSKLQHEYKSGESQAWHHSLCLLWWTLVINFQMCCLGMLRFHPWLIPCFMMT